MRSTLQAFFDEFVDAFASFDGSVIAQRYIAPFMSLGIAGEARVFNTSSEIAAYFQAILEDYRSQGCVKCRFKDLQICAIHRNAFVGTVTWELLCANGSVLSSWRESYHLMMVNGSLKVRMSMDHLE